MILILRYENLDKNATNIQLLFSHASSMLPFLATMGIPNDSGTNFNFSNLNAENANRDYKTTKLNPVNSNLALVLYDCNGNNKSLPAFMVRAFHNENLVKLVSCQSVNCDLYGLINYLTAFTLICGSTEQICDLPVDYNISK